MIWKQLLFWALEWFAGKAASFLAKRLEQSRRAEERAHEARKELERLKEAKTEEEVERAAKDTLGL
jgi:hypothetical protein